jgi:hypothetical protein
MKKWNIFFRYRTPTYPNFFYSISLPMDKVYYTKNNFWIAIPYRKIGRKKWSEKSEILKSFFNRFFTFKIVSFYFKYNLIRGRTILLRCHLGMGCMGHGRKKYSKFVTKIPIFTYSTLVHLDSTLNHSKSCRGLFFVHFVKFWGRTDIIWRS